MFTFLDGAGEKDNLIMQRNTLSQRENFSLKVINMHPVPCDLFRVKKYLRDSKQTKLLRTCLEAKYDDHG